MASQDFPIDILDFLKRAALGEGRIVSSGDLTTLQIAEAQAVPGRFYVDPATSLGWAILPWHLRCPKDKEREDARITIPGSSSPIIKQEDDPANYPDPRFKWNGKPVEVRGSVVWFKPADGNGEHGWPQFNPYEAKRMAIFINSAIAPNIKQEDDREWVKLHELREGAIFETKDGVRAVKSEYSYDNNGGCQCIILESGEYAHFCQDAGISERATAARHNDTLVREITIPDSNPPAKSEDPTKPTESVQSEPIKDLVEQARQISTPQSVQSEGKVRYFRPVNGFRANKCVRVIGEAVALIRKDGTTQPYGHCTLAELEAGVQRGEWCETDSEGQPKDSKDMGPEWLPPGLQKWDHKFTSSGHDIDQRDIVWRSALKYANERAEAAEKELATLKGVKS